MTIRTLIGDCRDILPTLPANSVQCCVTSPPYLGLRDYGTAQWNGGDADCDHIADRSTGASTLKNDGRPNPGILEHHKVPGVPYRDACGKCGARRIDRQIGLEASPEEYIGAMVGVFREVRRVLRDDGTLWLNLGSLYASGQSRQRDRALACDSGGTEPLDSPAADYACSDPGDECPNGSPNHHDDSVGIGRQPPPEQQRGVLIDHDSAHWDFAGAAAELSLSSIQRCSTIPSWPRNVRVASDPACQDVGRASAPTLQPAIQPCAHMGENTADTSPPIATSVDRISGKGLSSKACDCGSCGICFAYLTMKCLRFKAKDLMLMPELLALALQADGWILRSQIVWHKPGPMPESTRDRPTSAYEMVYLLTKKPRYYFDLDAIREPSGAAPRNVWTIASAAFSGSHFATFSPTLAERCIRAGTSERGCCSACGAPWTRQTETQYRRHENWFGDKQDARHSRGAAGTGYNEPIARSTTGWAASCACDAPTQPCTVLDCFSGAGTTLLVADRLQRHAVGIELNPAYAAMGADRVRRDAPLLAEIA